MKGPTKLELHPAAGTVNNNSVPSQKQTEPTALEPIDNNLLTKAIQALVKYHNDTVNKAHDESNTTPLLGSDVAIHVQFSLARVPERTSHRPIRLNLPHPLFRFPASDTDPTTDTPEQDHLNDVDVCLIVKDDAKQGIKELIDLFPHHKAMSRIKKVLTLTSLRTKYGKYANRRELLARFDVFMADDRILPMLGRALGKNFFEKKKQPIPIRITQTKQLPFVVDACLRGTFLLIRPGTCVSIKAGHTDMSTLTLIENIQAVISQAVPHMPRKWANVMSISIKTHQSVALPIYNKTREELQMIAEIANSDSMEDETDKVVSSKKKRARDTHDEHHEDLVPKSKHASTDQVVHTIEKQKKDSAVKSPLIQALKKQKKGEEIKVNVEKDNIPKKGSYDFSSKSSEMLQQVGAKKKSLNVDDNALKTKVVDKKEKESKVKADELAKQVKMNDPKVKADDIVKQVKMNDPKVKADDLVKQVKISEKSSTSTVQKVQESVQKNKKETAKDDKKPGAIESRLNSSTDKKKPGAGDSTLQQSKTITKPLGDDKKTDDPFIAASKFVGAKKGYVFRSGLKGLGYYKDTLPIVDAIALKKVARGNKRA